MMYAAQSKNGFKRWSEKFEGKGKSNFQEWIKKGHFEKRLLQEDK